MQILKFDHMHFPRTCCGVVYYNSFRYMEHFLPEHEVAGIPPTPGSIEASGAEDPSARRRKSVWLHR